MSCRSIKPKLNFLTPANNCFKPTPNLLVKYVYTPTAEGGNSFSLYSICNLSYSTNASLRVKLEGSLSLGKPKFFSIAGVTALFEITLPIYLDFIAAVSGALAMAIHLM